MRQVIKNIPQPTQPLTINEAMLSLSTNKAFCIAYETAQKTGLAILTEQTFNRQYGFAYHSGVIRGIFSNLKYTSSSKANCVIKALDAGRTVILFESFEEFLQYSINYTKL